MATEFLHRYQAKHTTGQHIFVWLQQVWLVLSFSPLTCWPLISRPSYYLPFNHLQYAQERSIYHMYKPLKLPWMSYLNFYQHTARAQYVASHTHVSTYIVYASCADVIQQEATHSKLVLALLQTTAIWTSQEETGKLEVPPVHRQSGRQADFLQEFNLLSIAHCFSSLSGETVRADFCVRWNSPGRFLCKVKQSGQIFV